MRVRKITLLKIALFLMLAFPTSIFAQAPTVNATNGTVPSNVTYRTTMTINGTNFVPGATVNFYASGSTGTTVAALATTYVSTTQLTVVVPAVVASGGAASTRYLSVSKTVSGTTTTSAPAAYTYTPPAHTPSYALVDRIITSYGGYWSTTTAANNTVQPDLNHSLYAFRYGGVLYSTGNNATTDANILTTLNGNSATGTYTLGNWRALPVNNIAGNNPGAPVYLVLGSLIDGSATTSVPTAPSVTGLSARDVLIDGTRGLGLGTGVTNLPSTSPLTFTAGNILENRAGDDVPDILVTQVADPTTTNFTTYCFVNAAGNIVGVPVEINMSAIAKLGTYKSDFFTLANTSFNTATVNGVGTPGGPTRDIRILAYKLSDFGITESNKADVAQFKVLTNGSDDMAFMAYNRDTFTIPAPEITSQPTSKAVCPGGSATFTIAITSTSTGTENPVYQWERNGVSLANGATGTGSVISGATSASMSITGITAADYGIYRCVVTNSVGAAFSNSAYLNTVQLSQSSATATCQSTTADISVNTATGNTPLYQWYKNTTNSTTGGTAISGATSATYTPAVTTAGTTYYYAQTYPTGYPCAVTTSSVIPFTVYGSSAAGTITANQSICTGSTATVALTGYIGAIQWQSSEDGSNFTDISGATFASYTSAALTATTSYRANVTNGNCNGVTSTVSIVTVSPVSVAGTPSANQSICANSTASVSVSGAIGAIQWQSSANGTTFTNISGATSATYTTPALTATTYYKAIVTSGSCSAATSGVIKITVSQPAVAGTISDNQTICPGTSGTVTLTGYTGTIQWQQTQVSNGASGWADIAGATGASYTNTAVNGITYYRAVVTGGACGSAISGIASLTSNTTYIWTGNTSINWNTASNWSCNLVPTAAVDVTIPAAPVNQPTVNPDGTAHAKSLTVNTGAHLTVATGGTIQVVNQVAVNGAGTFIINNNGALVQDNDTNNSGNITVVKNSNPLFRLDYTMWSSPVNAQNLLSFSPATSTNRFYEYKYALDPNSNTMREQYFVVNPATTNFEQAKGYLIRMPNADATANYNQGTAQIVFAGAFTGVPYNGTINHTISDAGDRDTAIGNPYASPISLYDFFYDANNITALAPNTGIYLWRKKNDSSVSSYAVVSLAGFVANGAVPDAGTAATPNYQYGGQLQAGYFTGPSNQWLISQGQGFIVKTSDTAGANPHVSFTNSMRRAVPTSGNQAFFRSADEAPSRLYINLSDNDTKFIQTAVAYMDGMTTGLDYAYDAEKISASKLNMYSIAGTNQLAIQARPAFDATDIVPMGYLSDTPGTYSIAVDHREGVFANGQKAFVKDNLLGLTHDLDTPYTFATEAGTFNDRFEIVYTTDTALGTTAPELASNSVIVFKQGSDINVTSGSAQIINLNVFDIRGRQLYSKSGINANDAVISGLTIQQEVIIVEVTTEKGKVSKKVIF